MAITAKQIAELRERTGSGMMDCKNALVEANGDAEKAIEVLRKKGMAKAAKKADREAREGIIESYIHSNGKIGVLVEVLSETDFVAKNDEFKTFAHDVALHIAAMNPKWKKKRKLYVELWINICSIRPCRLPWICIQGLVFRIVYGFPMPHAKPPLPLLLKP